jgi:PAS domain S-box-containing protein
MTEIDSYKELWDEIPDFIYFHDLTGKFIQVNAALERFFKYKKEKLLGHRITEFIHPDYQDRFDDYLSEVLLKGESAGPLMIMDKAAKTYILEYHSKLVNRGGKPFGVRGIARDVSERKRLERTLHERETLYRTLFENAKDAIFLMEEEFFIDCNPRALEMFGCGKEDIVNKPPYFFSPEFQPDGRLSREKAGEKIRAAFRGHPQHFEWLHARLDGTPFDTIVNLYRIDVEKKKIIVAMVHDISSHKEAMKALEASERNYRELVENANVAIYRFTPEGVFTFVNRYGEDLFGFSREELVRKKNTIGTILPDSGPESAGAAVLFRNICEHTERYYENENINLTKDGREVYMSWRNQPIKDEDGNIVEILSIGVDVTKVRQLEKELLQAKKLEAIGTLAGGIAHDFNNILGGMMGYVSLLKEQHKPDDVHYGILDKIDEAGSRATDLIKQLLAFSRRGKFESRPVDINQRIREVVGILRHSITKRITINTELAGDLPAIEGDPTQLDQVIMNICLNGVQAMTGKGTLAILTEAVSSDQISKSVDINPSVKTYVVLSIADTGRGMDSATLERIFEPFFTTKGTGEGTGLGLSTVYGIVANHGGSISVESMLEKGTTFHVYFPATDEAVAKQQPDKGKMNSIAGKGTILIVDDEDVFREMLKDVLEYLGYHVLEAGNGKKGIDIFKLNQKSIDLVILDMNMPVMDGREMFRSLKKLQPDVKAILATGFTLNGEVQTLMEEGIMGFIQKPFRIADISQAINDILKLDI